VTPEQWRSQGRFRTIDGRRLFCAQAGGGPTLLLLHAYPTASWGFHRIWPALASRFRVLAPDLLGSGFSDKPKQPVYDISSLTDLLEKLLDQLDVDRMHVLAHAYGVTTAQELLARRIKRDQGRRIDAGPAILSMCFVNGGLDPDATDLTLTQKLLLSPIGPIIPRLAPTSPRIVGRKLRKVFGSLTPPSDDDIRAICALLRHNDGHLVVPYALRYLHERRDQRERWVGALTLSPAPMCLLNGAADPVAGRRVPQFWSNLLPEAPMMQLDPRVGHYPPLEDPEGLLEAYFNFLRDHVDVQLEPASLRSG